MWEGMRRARPPPGLKLVQQAGPEDASHVPRTMQQCNGKTTKSTGRWNQPEGQP